MPHFILGSAVPGPPPVPAHRVMPCALGYILHASRDLLSLPVKREQHRGPLQRLHCAVWVGPGTSWAKSSDQHKAGRQWVFTAVTDTPCPRAHLLLFPAGSEPLFEALPAFSTLSQPAWTHLLVRDRSKQRRTHLVSSGASIFLLFQLL